MTNFTRLTAAVFSLMLIGCIDMSAANYPFGFDIHKYAYKSKSNRERKGLQMQNGSDLTRADVTVGALRAPEAGYPVPDVSLPGSHMIGDLDAPDGSVWFYTADFKYDYEELSEYYKRPIMREYEFKIYDGDLNFVGSIKDKVSYKE